MAILTRKGKPLALYLFDENNSKGYTTIPAPGMIFKSRHLSSPTQNHPGTARANQWFRPWNLMDIMINVLGLGPFRFISLPGCDLENTFPHRAHASRYPSRLLHEPCHRACPGLYSYAGLFSYGCIEQYHRNGAGVILINYVLLILRRISVF